VDEAVLREKVGQLLSAVRPGPDVSSDRAPPPDEGAEGRVAAMKREMAALEDSLDHIRLAIKYLVFDLEATKRENRLLRQMLGEA